MIIDDLKYCFKTRRVWWYTASSRTKARFARTSLGSFWLGLSNLLSILALGAIYLLQIVDAGVESHFIHFDVTDDLSLEVQPTVLYSQIPGININLRFK